MTDNHSKEIRSYNMSHIHAKDTKPEVLVRKYLFSKGLRFLKNDKRYPGRPDIVFPKYKTMVFVNGCFWHVHDNCPYFVIPKTNTVYWTRKLTQNKERDENNIALLSSQGWHIIVIWECELKKNMRIITLDSLYNQIIENHK